MVRRAVKSRNAPKNDSSVSIPRSSARNNGLLMSFTAPESEGLRVLFAGFIDLYCEAIPELRRAHMKKELRRLMVEMGVVPELFFSASFGPVRLISSQLLSNLVRQVIMKATGHPDNLAITGQVREVLKTSRFRTEFHEIETIGRGGFGQVYKVVSNVDKHQYAIKKIVARDPTEQLSLRILHEIQILAACQHVNIVRYHCGWIELDNVPIASTSSPSFTPPPPRQRKESPRINIEEIFDSTSSEDASQSVQAEQKENGAGDESSMTSMSSVGSAVAKKCPVGGKFWNGGGMSSGSSTVFSEAPSHSASAVVPVRNGEMSITSASSMGSALVKKSPVGGRFWNKETSGESIEDESTDKQPSPVLATAIPLREKRGGKGDGEYIEGGENGVDSGKEIVLAQMKVRMVIFIQMELCSSTVEKFLLARNEQLIRQSSPVDGQECLSLFRQLISAVEYIHEKGLIHRDIKPGNLFLKTDRRTSTPHLLLGDFGLSCLDGEDVGENGERDRRYLIPSSSHSQGVGTTTYAAPEQMRTTKYGREVDLYSSGIVLLELFSVVGTGSERLAVIERLREGRELPEDVKEKWTSISSLVLRLTSPNPEERPTAAAVLEELNEDATEIRNLKEMVSNQKAELEYLRGEVKRLKAELSKKNRKRAGESGSSL